MGRDASSPQEIIRNRSTTQVRGAASPDPRSNIGQVGHHRPVYFWGGPDTVRMNRLKFMGQPVNERVHLQAHTPGAARALAEAGFNWAYLMYSWGFPPEQDRAQRESFRGAVEVFHQAGIPVFG